MKLTILGAYAPYAPQDSACNGYIVESGDTLIMLDCGNGSFAKLQKYRDFRKLNALIITHYHPDHFHDYHCIRHAIAGSIRDGSRRDPLRVYAPAQGEPWQEMSGWGEVFQMFPVEDYIGGASAILDEMSFVFQENEHTVPCYAVAFASNSHKASMTSGRLVYTSDTKWYDQLEGFAAGAKLLLCEASQLNADIRLSLEKGHLTAGQAGELARCASVEKLVLTHLWPELAADVLLSEAREIFPNVCLAEEGLDFTI